jgi:hypothetical protein
MPFPVDEHISVRQNPRSPAVLDDVVQDLTQVIVLVHEPFSDELPRGQAHSRRLRGSIKAAKNIGVNENIIPRRQGN